MKCPYCKQPIDSKIADLPRMSARQFRIFNALLHAGEAGMQRDDLLVRMYDKDEWPTPGGGTVLRVSIHGINKILAQRGMYIEGKRMGCYRLIERKDEEGEIVTEERAAQDS